MGGVNSAVQRWLQEVKNMCDIEYTDDLLAYCDADDIWTRDKLEVQVSYMVSNSDCWLSYHDLAVINENGVFKRRLHLINTIYLNDSFEHYATIWNHLTSTWVMYRAKYINYIIPMPLWFWITQDKWTALVLLGNGVNFWHIWYSLAYYRQWHMSLMKRENWASKNEKNKVWIKYINELQNRFPDKDLSYYLSYNTDRRINWQNKWYSNILIYILMFFKYPKVFFDWFLLKITDVISLIKLKLFS